MGHIRARVTGQFLLEMFQTLHEGVRQFIVWSSSPARSLLPLKRTIRPRYPHDRGMGGEHRQNHRVCAPTFECLPDNPNVEYETLPYADGTTSCNCKGWTRRVAPDGSRSCKHCRYVDMGAAVQHCTATHHYENQPPQTKEQIYLCQKSHLPNPPTRTSQNRRL